MKSVLEYETASKQDICEMKYNLEAVIDTLERRCENCETCENKFLGKCILYETGVIYRHILSMSPAPGDDWDNAIDYLVKGQMDYSSNCGHLQCNECQWDATPYCIARCYGFN